MKFLTYELNNTQGVGLQIDDVTYDLTKSSIVDSMQQLIENYNIIKKVISNAVTNGALIELEKDAQIKAPIPTPKRDIFCVGKNYLEHAKEFGKSGFDAGSTGGDEIPEFPIIFTKATTSVTGPNDPILSYLDPDNSVDYEGELAVIIQNGGRGIKKSEAHNHIFGYTVLNDVTARIAQKKHKQWVIGKGVDSFCPMGPVIITADELTHVGDLELTTHVNEELRQKTQVKDLIFDIPTLIETISSVITLMPGDIIATGTPVGVGIGFNPPIYLKPGDKVRVSVSSIGSIENPVI